MNSTKINLPQNLMIPQYLNHFIYYFERGSFYFYLNNIHIDVCFTLLHITHTLVDERKSSDKLKEEERKSGIVVHIP